MDTDSLKYLKLAVKIADKGIENGFGPFGAIIVCDGKIVSRAGNSVTKSNDSTAHAEINAIRKACKKLKSFNLSDCVLYSSCEPCPMCLSAIYWSGIKTVYFASTREDADKAGFSDKIIYAEFNKRNSEKSIHLKRLRVEDSKSVFEKWNNKIDKIKY